MANPRGIKGVTLRGGQWIGQLILDSRHLVIRMLLRFVGGEAGVVLQALQRIAGPAS